MTLIDASVIVDYLRSHDAKLLSAIQACNPAICGVTRTELLAGARSPGNRRQLVSLLDSLSQISLSDRFWDDVGDHLAVLRAKGVTVPFPDAVLSTLAIALGIELWSRDQHFVLIQAAAPVLQLYREKP